MKKLKSFARCATKPIDGLIWITDGEQISFVTSESAQNSDLGEVRILKFICQDEASTAASFR